MSSPAQSSDQSTHLETELDAGFSTAEEANLAQAGRIMSSSTYNSVSSSVDSSAGADTQVFDTAAHEDAVMQLTSEVSSTTEAETAQGSHHLIETDSNPLEHGPLRSLDGSDAQSGIQRMDSVSLPGRYSLDI